MMTRQERAKQFAPFDAMKGLGEALRDREERHSRVERHGISEEKAAENSRTVLKLQRGMTVCVSYYRAFHDTEIKGILSDVDLGLRRITVDGEQIWFDDIYTIGIIDVSRD